MKDRVVSGYRPSGRLHLGHYHGNLKTMIGLQETHECYFFVADWHALTTGYRDTSMLGPYTTEMVVDWLAAGLDPGTVSYTHLRAHETRHDLVCRLLHETKKQAKNAPS